MKKILGVCIGSCIHVAGVLNFLADAKKAGVETPVIDSLINIADSIFGKNFRKIGRNLKV